MRTLKSGCHALLVANLALGAALFSASGLDAAELITGRQISLTHKLQLTPPQQRAMDLTLETVHEKTFSKVISTHGEVRASENNYYDINPPIGGTVTSATPQQGDVVTAGQVLATIRSTDVAELIRKLISDKATLESNIARTVSSYEEQVNVQKKELSLDKLTLERQASLYREGIAAEKDYQDAKNAFETAQVKLQSLAKQRDQDLDLQKRQLKLTMQTAEGQLRLMGLSEQVIEEAVNKGKVAADIPVRSPIAGIVCFRDITRGENIPDNKRIFSVVKLSPIWVLVDVPEGSLREVCVGQSVRIKTPFGSYLRGTISAVNPVVEKPDLSAQVRIVTPNSDCELRPGMTVSADILLAGTERTGIMVPATAVIGDEDRFIVYVADGDSFQPVFVGLGVRRGDLVEIKQGLFSGEKIVVRGAVQLKALSLYKASEQEKEETAQVRKVSRQVQAVTELKQRVKSSLTDHERYVLAGLFGGMTISAAFGAAIAALVLRRR